MTSATRYSHRVRCVSKKCGTRFRIKRPLEDYVRRPKCSECGSNLYSIEAQRRRQVDRETTCHCHPYPFPHRAGSLRLCHEHPLADVEPTDEEWQQFEDCLRTPRSG